MVLRSLKFIEYKPLQAGAFFSNELRGKQSYYFEDKNVKRPFGKIINASCLASVFYFNNYFHMYDRFYHMYLKFGFPFRNSGIGITAFSLMDSKQISVSGQVKLWSQEDYGKGFFLGSTAGCRLADRFGLQLQVGYKTAGNVVDQTIQSGFLVSGSMNYISKNF